MKTPMGLAIMGLILLAQNVLALPAQQATGASGELAVIPLILIGMAGLLLARRRQQQD